MSNESMDKVRRVTVVVLYVLACLSALAGLLLGMYQ